MPSEYQEKFAKEGYSVPSGTTAGDLVKMLQEHCDHDERILISLGNLSLKEPCYDTFTIVPTMVGLILKTDTNWASKLKEAEELRDKWYEEAKEAKDEVLDRDLTIAEYKGVIMNLNQRLENEGIWPTSL